jgi:hypothetical protein
MDFDPAGTSWSVFLFPNESMTGEQDGEAWEFNQDSSMSSGTLWRGKYQRMPDTDNGFRCEIVRPSAGDPQYDRFEIYFISTRVFAATKDDSLYRIGKRIDPAQAIIDLTIVIDTNALVSKQVSTWDSPAECGHGGAFMLTDGAHAAGGNGTADLQLRSGVGDQLRIWGASVSNQFQDEVFIYDFKYRKGDRVLDTQGMKPQAHKHYAMVPQPGNPSHSPPKFEIQARRFNANVLEVISPGKEHFHVMFAVYGPVKDAKGARPLKGYYRWDPSITAILEVPSAPAPLPGPRTAKRDA